MLTNTKEDKEDSSHSKDGLIQELLSDRIILFLSYSETVMNKKKMSNFNAMYKNMHENNVTSAYWCRDQNFRKYFEMRKKNDIEPSVDYNNFYNKDKCKAYYDGLVEMTFMRDQVRHVTDK